MHPLVPYKEPSFAQDSPYNPCQPLPILSCTFSHYSAYLHHYGSHHLWQSRIWNDHNYYRPGALVDFAVPLNTTCILSVFILQPLWAAAHQRDGHSPKSEIARGISHHHRLCTCKAAHPCLFSIPQVGTASVENHRLAEPADDRTPQSNTPCTRVPKTFAGAPRSTLNLALAISLTMKTFFLSDATLQKCTARHVPFIPPTPSLSHTVLAGRN